MQAWNFFRWRLMWIWKAGDPIPKAWRRFGTCPFSRARRLCRECTPTMPVASDSHNKNPLCISSQQHYQIDKANHDIYTRAGRKRGVRLFVHRERKAVTQSRAKGRLAFSLMFTWPSMSFALIQTNLYNIMRLRCAPQGERTIFYSRFYKLE